MTTGKDKAGDANQNTSSVAVVDQAEIPAEMKASLLEQFGGDEEMVTEFLKFFKKKSDRKSDIEVDRWATFLLKNDDSYKPMWDELKSAGKAKLDKGESVKDAKTAITEAKRQARKEVREAAAAAA